MPTPAELDLRFMVLQGPHPRAILDSMDEKPGRARCLATLCLLLAGCSSPPQSVLPESKKVPDISQALQAAFKESESIRFRSYNGEWIGTDGDVEIVLFNDGRVETISYGQASAEKYAGRYIANSDLTITLKKGEFGGHLFFGSTSLWVYRDDASLLLAPADSSGRNDRDPFWPFRQITLDDPAL